MGETTEPNLFSSRLPLKLSLLGLQCLALVACSNQNGFNLETTPLLSVEANDTIVPTLTPTPGTSPTPSNNANSLLTLPPSRFASIASGTVTLSALNWNEAKTLAKTAVANTRIVLPAGTINGLSITLEGPNGLENKPIIVEGQNDGSTVVTGKVNIILKGHYVLLKNIKFLEVDSATYGGGAANLRFSACAYCGVTNSRFEKTVDPVMNSGVDQKRFVSIQIDPDSQSVEVYKNSFLNKKNAGSSVLVNRSTTRTHWHEGHQICGNLFKNRELQGSDANDFDSIRVGDSASSQSPSPTVAEALMTQDNLMVGNTIEFNVFENTHLAPTVAAVCAANSTCSAEPEIISVKAPQTIVRFNTFRGNNGGLTLRHGFQSIVEGNYFSGKNTPEGLNSTVTESYGIRVIGENHLVLNNHFENLSSTSKLKGGISILPGQPNAANNGYWPVYDSIIAMNWVKNTSSYPVSFSSDYGNRSKTISPVRIAFSYNIISGGATKAVINQDSTGESALATHDFLGNIYDNSALGITTGSEGFNKVGSVSVTAHPTGFQFPTEDAYTSPTGVLATNTSKKQNLLSDFKTNSGDAAHGRLQKLMGFTRIDSGSLYNVFTPQTPAQVGSTLD